ncbi:spindle pole body component 110-like [Phalaenopsis equestris]|uniref:spindle pole body component 110-like n=1 Tax=Phalaenopsis equestris TaxID=78828 RepID=UPI0009E37DC9|nr:spindle pole body component 110-like [Phalaenopsis equestris]
MVESEKAVSSSSSLELDPLLKDLNEKKLSFRRNVVSLTAELKDVRNRLASREESLTQELQLRQVAETKAKTLEEEIVSLHECLNERDCKLKSSCSASEKYLKELDDLRSKLSVTNATAEASAASAQAAQSQCLSLLKELDEKNSCIKENEVRLNLLGEQLDQLQRTLQERELSQKQLKEHVLNMENEIQGAVARAGDIRDCELQRILDEISIRNYEKINKLLIAKDDEISRLRDEIRFLSAQWKHKTKELESQLEKHRRADQELKKKVLKLEFCLQETRSQMRKLQRMGEKRDMALRELREQISLKQRSEADSVDKQNFWESSMFKVIISMSMLVLVAVVRR